MVDGAVFFATSCHSAQVGEFAVGGTGSVRLGGVEVVSWASGEAAAFCWSVRRAVTL